MSFEYDYYFCAPEPLHEIAKLLRQSLSIELHPLEHDPTVYLGDLLGLGMCLTHNFPKEDLPEFMDYPYCLTGKAYREVLYFQPSLFFSVIYMMYRRMGIKKGVWAGDSLQIIAEYNFICGDHGWEWYDLTNNCIAGYADEHVEDYMLRIFPR